MATVLRESMPAMPAGTLEGPSAWRGEDMAGSTEWIFGLDQDDIVELERALAEVESRKLPIEAVTMRDFQLPRLSARLVQLRRELLAGRGFALIRGLPMERYSLAQAATLYWGLGAYLGKAVSQNAQGHLLGHVIDIGRSIDDPGARTYQTNARQNYHADSCDIVGLLCLHKARKGGASTIVSSVTLYNEFLRRASDLLPELFEVFHVDRRGEVPAGAEPWYLVPVFNWHGGFLTSQFTRRYITSARRLDGVPALTERQIACFDLLDEIAEEPEIHLEMDFEPGDIQFLHNHQVFHDRTAFEDFDAPEKRRHLLRLWLCPPNGRPLPPAYAQRWGSIEPGDRGGVRVEGTRLHAPLTPA